MRPIEQCCCFTGHRPNRLPWLADPHDHRTQALTDALWRRIQASYEGGYTCFLSGMALGVDLICAELVLRLRAETDGAAELIPVIPWPGQAERWRQEDRRRYREVLQVCGENLVVVSPSYSRTCYYLRNRYLVEYSAKIIGVYDGSPTGGTHQTLEYARQNGLEMELLMPE
ncbi:MAG: DUF1273 domain-containing protein [Clostridiales bacterium]|nr:DUF1273 domain-containing protein [Clostridiales bacterium]